MDFIVVTAQLDLGLDGGVVNVMDFQSAGDGDVRSLVEHIVGNG
jgi:hypothetical protein